ncbi:hypothetical protein [Enterococcus faecalis]|uniref:hypothetical protein n=1 Tax=Enterococcus faecalis TaxID=1351 RepID=UPI003BA35F9C
MAMQGILVLNETTVKSNGLYTLPSGVDKSYFTEIKKDTKNEVTDKQLLAGCTILYVHDKKNGFQLLHVRKGRLFLPNRREKTIRKLSFPSKEIRLSCLGIDPERTDNTGQ